MGVRVRAGAVAHDDPEYIHPRIGLEKPTDRLKCGREGTLEISNPHGGRVLDNDKNPPTEIIGHVVRREPKGANGFH